MLYLNTALDGLQFGLCYAILAMALYISYTILDFPDLSVDGIFPFGGIVGTIIMFSLRNSSLPSVLVAIIAIIVAMIAGMLAGGVTGLLHVKLHISKLLCGIIIMTGFSSITLAMTMLLTQNGFTSVLFNYGSNNIHGLFNLEFLRALTNDQRALVNIGIMLVIVIIAKIIIDLFLKTKIGFMLRSTGNNEQLVTSLGQNPGKYKIIGLMLADGLVGISGCMYAQLMLQYDNTSGAGKVVIGLVSVIMGLALFNKIKFLKPTTKVILGAIIYSLALFFFTLIDTNGIFLKLFNAVFFTLILVLVGVKKDSIKSLFKPFMKKSRTDKENK